MATSVGSAWPLCRQVTIVTQMAYARVVPNTAPQLLSAETHISWRRNPNERSRQHHDVRIGNIRTLLWSKWHFVSGGCHCLNSALATSTSATPSHRKRPPATTYVVAKSERAVWLSPTTCRTNSQSWCRGCLNTAEGGTAVMHFSAGRTVLLSRRT